MITICNVGDTTTMSKQITIRDEIYNLIKEQKSNNRSWSDAIQAILNKNDNLQEATITQEGRISKALAGRTILYRIK